MPNQIDSFYRKILDDKGIKVDLEKSLWIDYVFNAKTLDYISVKMNKRKTTVKKMLRRYKIPRIDGGVKEFRKLINLDITDYGRGDFRSNIASSVGKRGFEGEVEIEKL